MKLNCENSIALEEKLALNKPLKVKIGFDPTSPDLHLGHYIVLRGAKKFQENGHQIIVIVGDFTAAIGDPSGRNKLRPPLTETEISENSKTYMEQVFMVLDKEKTEIVTNSKWLAKLNTKDILSILSNVTISQMLVREDFNKRFKEQSPIFMHEMVYPLMQGLDSVAIKADVEIGGTDQTFNLMMGREMQKNNKQKEQAVVTFPLLVGLDGKKKMSKSLGNHIGLKDTPTDKFGKIMSISDETMWNYLNVLIELSQNEINQLKSSGENPKNIKLNLATTVVSLFHGEKIANQEKENFILRFSKKENKPTETKEIQIPEDGITIGTLIKELNLANSISEANRKIEQGGVKINDETIFDKKTILQESNFIIKVGKLGLYNVSLSKNKNKYKKVLT